MRCVDADALIKKLGISRECDYCQYSKGPLCTWKPAFSRVCEIITDAPIIEPERKTGKWIECDHEKWNGDTFAYKCSECNGAYHLNIEKTIGVWDYCPNCGADMRGDQDDS